MEVALSRTEVMTSVGAGPGVLVSVDGALVAVFVRLELDFYGPERGWWNLEAGFGACDTRPREPFEALPHALGWVAAQVGAPASSVAAALQRLALADG